MANFIPLGDRIIVKATEDEPTTASGLVLPDSAKEKPQEGEVIAVGSGRVTDDGKTIPMEVKVGDKIVYSKYSGTEYKDNDQEYLILRESDVLVKLSS
tara:strand:+ start:2188 stop:2481 length:294 start_codon:yes stop_codon:yes gene_type:complete